MGLMVKCEQVLYTIKKKYKMFKKLVTNLPYSPGLLNQVGFYTKRLQQEEFTRRIGLIFGILALLVNINLSVFTPENSVLASPANDVVTGGIYGSTAKQMQDKAIAAMRSSPYTKAIYDYYGVTESDIQKTNIAYINNSDPQFRSVGKLSIGRGAESCKTNNGYRFCERSMHAAYNYRTRNVKVLQGAVYSKIGKSDSWFAIAESCGNIIIRVGKAEDIKVIKALSPNQDQVVEAGDTVSFRLKIEETSGNYAPFLKITDTLPEHTSFVDYSPKDLFDKVNVSGRTVTLTNTTDYYGGLGPNETRVIELKAKILASAPEGARLCNSLKATSLNDSSISASEPCVTIKENPVPQCVSLRMVGAGGVNTTRTFEAVAQPDGATISEYVFDFGDGETQVVKNSAAKVSTKHTYEPGSYTAKVLVKTSQGSVGNSGSCVTKITVDTPTPDPAVTCDYVRLVETDSDNLSLQTFEVAATPSNGATVSGYSFDFGDGKTATVANTSSNKVTIEHDYETPETYTVKATASTSLGEVTSESCLLSLEIEQPPEACEFNPTLPKDDPNCQPGPNIIKLKKAENKTQGIDDAHNTTAQGGDTIVYSLITENDGGSTFEDYEIVEALGDVLQYADIVDLNGGTLDEDGYVATWPKQDIEAGEVVVKKVTVKIKSPIPNTPVSASDSLAFDLRLENAYGNNVTIKLPNTPVKTVEEVVTTLPNTGPGLNAMVSTLFMGGITYFYFRNRLINKELGMIKTEFSGGMV